MSAELVNAVGHFVEPRLSAVSPSLSPLSSAAASSGDLGRHLLPDRRFPLSGTRPSPGEASCHRSRSQLSQLRFMSGAVSGGGHDVGGGTVGDLAALRQGRPPASRLPGGSGCVWSQ